MRRGHFRYRNHLSQQTVKLKEKQCIVVERKGPDGSARRLSQGTQLPPSSALLPHGSSRTGLALGTSHNLYLAHIHLQTQIQGSFHVKEAGMSCT